MTDAHTAPIHADHGSHDHGHAPAATGLDSLRFEKQELESFVNDDTRAGVAIGQLLAFLFCVLLTLMVGATIWTTQHLNISADPHDRGTHVEAAH